MNLTSLPVAVIGAGPVGLAAAAHLHERGIQFVVFELGDDVGASAIPGHDRGLYGLPVTVPSATDDCCG